MCLPGWARGLKGGPGRLLMLVSMGVCVAAVDGQAATAFDELARLKQDVQETDAELLVTRSALISARSFIDRLKQELAKAATDHEAAQAATRKELLAAKAAMQQLHEQLTGVNQEHLALTEQLAARAEQLSAAQPERDRLMTELSHLRTALEERETASQVAEDRYAALLARLEEVTAVHRALEATLLASHQRLQEMQAEREQLSARDAQMGQELVAAREQLREHQRQLLEAQHQRQALTKEFASAENAKAAVQRELEQDQFQFKRISTELAMQEQHVTAIERARAETESRLAHVEQQLADATQRGRELATEIELLRASRNLPPSSGARGGQSEARGTGASSLKVHGVSEERGFVVLYVKGIDWTKKGTRMLLQPSGSPPLEVKITEINRWGLAVAYIQGRTPRPLPIKGGDLVQASPII